MNRTSKIVISVVIGLLLLALGGWYFWAQQNWSASSVPEPKLSINGYSGDTGVVQVRWPGTYKVSWSMAKESSCQVFGYFGNGDPGNVVSLWKDVDPSGEAVVTVANPSISKATSFVYILSCDYQGQEYGATAHLEVI